MKFFKVFLIVLLAFTSCKSSNDLVNSGSPIVENMSARKVSKKHKAVAFDKKTIEAKLKIVYKDNKNKQGLSVKLRIDKDKVIWLNATYIGVIVARAKITPNKVSYYEKINKTYFEGNFELLRNVLGTEVNFYQLQNLLLGQSIFDLQKEKYRSVVNNDAHLLLPVEQKALFDILFWVNPSHFKLDKQALKNPSNNQLLEVNYKKYSIVSGENFPKTVQIRAKENAKFTNIDIEYKTVVFNKKFSTPFNVPKGYKQVVF